MCVVLRTFICVAGEIPAPQITTVVLSKHFIMKSLDSSTSGNSSLDPLYLQGKGSLGETLQRLNKILWIFTSLHFLQWLGCNVLVNWLNLGLEVLS